MDFGAQDVGLLFTAPVPFGEASEQQRVGRPWFEESVVRTLKGLKETRRRVHP